MNKMLILLTAVTAALSALFLFCNKNPVDNMPERPGIAMNNNFFITYPRANSRINLDSTLNILWIASSNVVDSPNVRITLYKDSLPLKTIASSAPNDGAYGYKMERAASGTGYKIRISTFPDTTKYDYSGVFEIYSNYSGTITVTYPDSKSCLMIDSTDTLRWETTEFPGTRVRLELYSDTSFISTIVESMVMSIHKYPWSRVATPLGTGSQYRIKAVSENDESFFCFSDYFKIASIYNGGFVIKSPAESTEWPSGYNYSISWDTTGSPGPDVKIQLYTGDTLLSTIAAKTPDNGKYQWTTQYGMTTGSNYRIKITSAYDPGLFAYSSPFTITGIDRDIYEPDNRKSAAHKIPFDSLENRTITINDTDWISFTADSGSDYLIVSQSQEHFQIECALFQDTAGAVIASEASSANGTLIWLWSCVKSGKYYGRIVSKVTGNSGEYTLKISSFNPSALLSFKSPASGANINAGTALKLQWTPDTLIFGPSVQIFFYKGSKRISIPVSDSVPDNGSFDWEIPAGFVSGKDYSIRIVSVSNSRLYAQGPVFTITGTDPDSFEVDDSRSLASDITMDVLQKHSISYNDTDWVRFSATRNSRYMILLNCSDSLSAIFNLYQDTARSSVMTKETQPNGRIATIWTCPAGAIYYGCITAASHGRTGNYSLLILPFDSSTSVKFSSPLKSSVLFTGMKTTISWAPDTVFLGDSVTICLYKGNTQVSVLAAGCASDVSGYSWNISDSLAAGNDYRIKVANAKDSSFCGFSQKFIVSNFAPDSFEDDGTPKKASVVIFDSLQQHTITYNDTDYIKFDADSGSRYLIAAAGTDMFRISGILTLDSSTVPELTFLSNTNGQSNAVWSCSKSGVCYVKIISYTSGNSGAYSFKVRLFDPQNVVSFIAPSKDSVWSADSTYKIRWNTDIDLFGANVTFNLYKESKKLLTIGAAANNGSYSWKIPSGLATGTDYNVQLVSSLNASLYGFSHVFTINGMTGDKYEPDNSWSEAHSYSLGTEESHNLTYNDTDWVKFSAESGAKYVAMVNGTVPLQASISFFYENDWTTPSTFPSDISGVINSLWQCSKTTTAYARINLSGSGVFSSGTYSLKIVKYDSTKTVTFISPTAGMSIVEGDSIPVEWAPDTGFLGQKVIITLLKGNTSILTKTNVTNSGKFKFPVPVNAVLSGDDYRVKISNITYSQFGGVSPLFSIEGIDAVPDAYEVDNTYGACGTIGVDETQQRNLIFNDTDWVSFQMTPGERYVLMGNRSAGNDIFVRIHYGTPAAAPEFYQFSNNSNNFRKLISSATGGKCYIEIYSSSSNVYTAYTLKAVRYDATNALKITNPAEGSVVKSGINTTISWTCDTSVIGRSVNIYLYDGNTLAATYSSNNTGSYYWTAAGLISGNNYRLKIVSVLDTSLNAFSPIFTINGVNVDEFEPDNTPAQAKEITFGSVQNHNIILNDTDWIKIPAQNGYNYIFEYSATTGLDIRAYLYDSTNLKSYTYSSYCLGGDTALSLWTCKKSGTYYLNIYPMSSYYGKGDYTVKVMKYDTSQNAKIIEPAAGAVLRAGNFNTISWTPDVNVFGSLINIEIYKGSNRVATEYQVSNTGSHTWLTPFYLENGTDYRICISRYNTDINGSFSPNFTVTNGLEPDSYEPDGGKNSAKLISPDEVQYRTLLANDTDWVKFQADSGITYNFYDSTTSTQLEMIVMDQATDAWLKGISAKQGENTTSWLCPKTNTYYIRINVYSGLSMIGTPGRYSIRITTE